MLGFGHEIKRLMLDKHAFKNMDLYLVFHASLKANNIVNVWKVMNNTSGLLAGVYLIFQQVKYSVSITHKCSEFTDLERESGLKHVI